MHDIRILWQASPPITFNPNATWPEMANSNEARQTFAKLWRLFQQILSPARVNRIATKLRHPLFPAGAPNRVAPSYLLRMGGTCEPILSVRSGLVLAAAYGQFCCQVVR